MQLSLVALMCGASLVAACVPTAARKNARLESGFDADLIAGLQHVEAGERSDGSPAAAEQLIHLEADLQWAHRNDDGSGFAVQGKVPLNIVFTTLDFYYQVPETAGDSYFGFGAEVGALPGLYAVMTRYLDEEAYISLTPRALFAKSRNAKALLLNPQLTFGFAGDLDVSGFVSYAYHTGRGFDFDIDLFGSDDVNDYRKEYWLGGASLRF